MILTILLLHLWSVVLALFWLRLLRLATSRLNGEGSRFGSSRMGHFLGGIFAALLVFILAFAQPLPWLLPDVYGATTPASLVATALLEELSKWGVFLLGIYGAGATRSRREGTEQAAWVAVGFAVTQNAFYFMRYPELTMLLRPLLVTGANVAVASIWGYATSALSLKRALLEDLRYGNGKRGGSMICSGGFGARARRT